METNHCVGHRPFRGGLPFLACKLGGKLGLSPFSVITGAVGIPNQYRVAMFHAMVIDLCLGWSESMCGRATPRIADNYNE